jgi:hypothetical protein
MSHMVSLDFQNRTKKRDEPESPRAPQSTIVRRRNERPRSESQRQPLADQKEPADDAGFSHQRTNTGDAWEEDAYIQWHLLQ